MLDTKLNWLHACFSRTMAGVPGKTSEQNQTSKAGQKYGGNNDEESRVLFLNFGKDSLPNFVEDALEKIESARHA